MAGWDSSKQLAALDSVVALAAAGNLDLGIKICPFVQQYTNDNSGKSKKAKYNLKILKGFIK